METNTLHDLTAAYALDALDDEDARAYEAHLARCERCRDELASFSETASGLAYAVDSPAPPPELRARILQEAARERSNVVPLRPRWVAPLAAAAAVVAACAAIAFGLWAASLAGKLDSKDEALARQNRVAEILAAPGSRKVSFARGTLVVDPSGRAALVVRDLRKARPGKTYEAWVADGGAPLAAGLFDGGRAAAIPLERPVAAGATVMVTEEKDGGVDAPTQTPFIVVRNAEPS
jgi:anti-sigma-K factor RskA